LSLFQHCCQQESSCRHYLYHRYRPEAIGLLSSDFQAAQVVPRLQCEWVEALVYAQWLDKGLRQVKMLAGRKEDSCKVKETSHCSCSSSTSK